MTEIVLTVTEEELKRLDSMGIFKPDMAGVLWQSVTIIPAKKESEATSENQRV